jgi:hypothetical protein
MDILSVAAIVDIPPSQLGDTASYLGCEDATAYSITRFIKMDIDPFLQETMRRR